MVSVAAVLLKSDVVVVVVVDTGDTEKALLLLKQTSQRMAVRAEVETVGGPIMMKCSTVISYLALAATRVAS